MLVEIAGYVSQDLLQEFDVILMLTIDGICVCVLRSRPLNALNMFYLGKLKGSSFTENFFVINLQE